MGNTGKLVYKVVVSVRGGKIKGSSVEGQPTDVQQTFIDDLKDPLYAFVRGRIQLEADGELRIRVKVKDHATEREITFRILEAD